MFIINLLIGRITNQPHGTTQEQDDKMVAKIR